MTAVERWGRELARWAIPEEILAGAPESPWGFAPEPFRHRAERAIRLDPTTTTRIALEALASPGSVLDVGVGAGATSLPLVPSATRITGVDPSAAMLEAFLAEARSAGIQAAALEGTWPEAGRRVEPADVVVCGHVLYNVGELEPFVRALDDRARRRVVLELTATHPLAWMSDLWRRFHGLERPDGPTADDAVEAIRALGIAVRRRDETRSARLGGFERREDAIALVRRRLCLTADRDDEIAVALGDRLAEHDGLWSAGPARQRIVTLWWDAGATARQRPRLAT